MEIKRQAIYTQLNTARAEFHALLDSLSEQDFQQLWGRLPKGSSKWFAWLLNAVTGPFNWMNELGARGQGKIFTRKWIGKIYDRAYFSLLNKINSIKDDEWERGMYYPKKWDANFDEFMTLEKLFYYPVIHFNFHMTQIAH